MIGRRTTLVSSGIFLAAGLTALAVVRPHAIAQSPSTLGVLAATSPGLVEESTTYAVDSVHSSALFRINHLGVSNFWGRFNRITGTYTFDPANLEAASFAIDIAADSIDTNSDRRDGHLKSPDFFNAKEYPTVEFRSTKVVKNAGSEDGTYELHGELKLHNVAKRIRARLEWMGAKDTSQGFKSGFEATFSIRRTDFGMDTYVDEGGLGNRVRIVVAIEGARKADT